MWEYLDDNPEFAISHDAPTLPGATVTVEVTLSGVAGRSLTFDVQASDDNGVISAGTHRRGIIDRTL